MKLCFGCRTFKQYFEWQFAGAAGPEPFKISDMKHLKYCRTNFLDYDNKVKSCLQKYSELLQEKLINAA